VLGEDRGVDVVVDEHRQAQPLAHLVADRDVDQRQVDCRDRDAAGLVDRARDSEPRGRHVGSRVPRLDELALQRGEDLVLVSPPAGLGAVMENPLLVVDDGHPHLRSTEIDADRLGCAHRTR
jgi:hypothetical protein